MFPIYPPNTVIEKKGFYISYNCVDIAIYGSDTTAIVLDNMSKFLILNGDHRDAYKGLDYDACVQYFKDNAHLKNNEYSDDA